MAADEQIRAQIMQPRQTLELTKAEAWQLLGSVSLGRVVFAMHALPAIRPVNHLIDDETIIVRSHLGSAIVTRAGADDGAVVCYEADEIDPVRHTGWSVIATGMARLDIAAAIVEIGEARARIGEIAVERQPGQHAVEVADLD